MTMPPLQTSVSFLVDVIAGYLILSASVIVTAGAVIAGTLFFVFKKLKKNL